MANKSKKIENKQQDKQSAIPAEQAELTDEELKQVTGGGVIIDYGPAVRRDTIVLEE